jgi:hypothetical protein
MCILDVEIASLSWYQPQVRGKLPSPRLGHFSAVLGGNVLAVFGGYGDPDEGHMKFNDINLLHFGTSTACLFVREILTRYLHLNQIQ